MTSLFTQECQTCPRMFLVCAVIEKFKASTAKIINRNLLTSQLLETDDYRTCCIVDTKSPIRDKFCSLIVGPCVAVFFGFLCWPVIFVPKRNFTIIISCKAARFLFFSRLRSLRQNIFDDEYQQIRVFVRWLAKYQIVTKHACTFFLLENQLRIFLTEKGDFDSQRQNQATFIRLER